MGNWETFLAGGCEQHRFLGTGSGITALKEEKTMKKLFVLMTLIVLVVSLPLSVSADLIYTPRDDFLEEHRAECDYVDRNYITNGPRGELTVYKSPEDWMILGTIPNRQGIYISVTYTDPDGGEWGCVELRDKEITGWVHMSWVVPIYNESDFQREFDNRIKSERGDLLAFAGLEIRVWEYPGSEESETMIVSDDPYFASDYEYYCTFVDDAGQRWGKIIHLGDDWVCLDNPTADYDTLYANHAPQKVSKPEIQPETSPKTSDKVITPSGISPTTILIMAATVAAISAGLLVVLKKKKT
jgi:hypothetical protein